MNYLKTKFINCNDNDNNFYYYIFINRVQYSNNYALKERQCTKPKHFLE